MFKANLTWPLTIAYLETLMRHGMVRSEAVGSKLAYRVTEKGLSLLRSFIATEEAAAELALDKLDATLLVRVAQAKKKEAPLSLNAFRESLEKEGRKPEPRVRKGLSGVEHTFDLVMTDENGGAVGYIVSEKGTPGDVIRAFILQADCELPVHLLCFAEPEDEAKALAASYKLDLIMMHRQKESERAVQSR